MSGHPLKTPPCNARSATKSHHAEKGFCITRGGLQVEQASLTWCELAQSGVCSASRCRCAQIHRRKAATERVLANVMLGATVDARKLKSSPGPYSSAARPTL
eukprot:251381-Rhodomonas_salina.1